MNKNKLSVPKLIAAIVGGILILGVILIISLQDVFIGKLYITNATDLDIESISVTFEDDENEQYYEIYNGSVAKGGEIKANIGKKYDFTGTEQYCCAYVTFAGYDEIYVYDGYFDGIFKGNIHFDFSMDNGNYVLKTKAGNGMSEDTSATEMDTYFILYPEEADWDYYDIENGKVLEYGDFEWDDEDFEE